MQKELFEWRDRGFCFCAACLAIHVAEVKVKVKVEARRGARAADGGRERSV